MVFTVSDSDFKKMKAIIYEKSGIHFSESNRSILESRLKEKLRETKLETVESYYRLILSDKDEMISLLDSVTTNLTKFFRTLPHLDAFEHDIIPELIKYKKSKGLHSITIWSAGCSTGEEPYTLAMILLEMLPLGFTASIIASDISLKSLMIAKTGFYSEIKLADVSEKYKGKYFIKSSEGYQICDKIKNMIKFDYHNLNLENNFRNLDVIFCRNVIIYFDSTAQKIVVDKFWNALGNHSYLVVGHSESLLGMETPFKFKKTDRSTFYTKMIAPEI